MNVNTLRWLSLENLDNEEWKDIPGYEGIYEASSFGRIKSKERVVGNYYCRERILMQKIKQNYLYVNLSKEGNSKTIRVHRLIAMAFLPNPYNFPEVNHKDENPMNNTLENLEWCSQSYNLQYGTRIERGQLTKKLNKIKTAQKESLVKSQERENAYFQFVENLDNEEWRPVVGYENLYEISSCGRLKSLYHKIPFIVRTKTTRKGRINANLHRNGKYSSFGIHVLVAKAFIPNPNNLTEINHKDENPQNNNVENLEWCSHEYNMHYGTIYQRISSKLTNCKTTSKPVAQYKLNGEFIRIWPSIREVKRTLYIKGWKTICSACNGKSHSAAGYQWRYIGEGEVPSPNIGPCRRRCSTSPKTVYKYSLDKTFVCSYESVTEAARSVNISASNISACIKGKQKSAAGYLWFGKKSDS